MITHKKKRDTFLNSKSLSFSFFVYCTDVHATYRNIGSEHAVFRTLNAAPLRDILIQLLGFISE